ncbi:hypothetical protein N7481_005243 [Penicillium waksmanii]|uniref:uncharacterized protein n=1 Tax=Penicillium waksmanii TaxID=69791 RepID=UPI002549A107|nr:uncharacterized protein N7481_005243 [Penicillium waksmanii]KAJ5983144.1 hypothetical protein N7481_005243 [Penicillium waksmanii]
MRDATPGPFEDLRSSVLRKSKTIDEYWDVSKSHEQPKFWPESADKNIKKLQAGIHGWITRDPLHIVKCSTFTIPANNMPEKRLLFSQRATLCGLHMLYFNIQMHFLGQSLVTHCYDVQMLAFHYCLVKQEPAYEDLNWPDMETFIKIHGKSHIFWLTSKE